MSTFGAKSVTTGASTGETGGHWNYNVQLTFSSYDDAVEFSDAWAASANNGFGPPARFLSGPALHLENLDPSWSFDPGSGTYTMGGTAHIDQFNPNTGLAGMVGHGVYDFSLGHIVQLFHGNIDPKTCPFK